ncbi:MAG: helix-turn-helix domain-containing protein [Bryobacterales bacterium]|nr:helix-turn-helix domain-containing protein [Bryobacterales bacterium]
MTQRKKVIMAFRGDRLKLIREKRGLSQAALADLAGVSKRQITRYEGGSGDPTSDTLYRIAHALQCSVDFLLDLTDEQTGHVPEIAPDILRMARQFSELPEPLRNAIKAILRSQTNGSNGK